MYKSSGSVLVILLETKTSEIQSLYPFSISSSSAQGPVAIEFLFSKDFAFQTPSKPRLVSAQTIWKTYSRLKSNSMLPSMAKQPLWVLKLTSLFLCVIVVLVHVADGIQGRTVGLITTHQIIKGFGWTSWYPSCQLLRFDHHSNTVPCTSRTHTHTQNPPRKK